MIGLDRAELKRPCSDKHAYVYYVLEVGVSRIRLLIL